MIRSGDLDMARVIIQKYKIRDKVAELRYIVLGPFQNIWDIARGNYIIRKINKHNNSELNFMSEDLCILLFSLKPCELVDSSDKRYLNQSHDYVIYPLKKTLKS